MLFNSVEYLILLAIAVGLYWMLPNVLWRQTVVFVASAYFYMSWSVSFFLMLMGLILLNWGIGWQLARSAKRFWLILACVLNLGLLAYFKYAKFLIDSFVSALRWVDLPAESPQMSIILPLGISFYVFELISYLVDIHDRKQAHEKSPLAFSLFVLFFPHLIAGPICRANQFLPQIKTLQPFSGDHFYNGLYLFLAGFALKCGVADSIAPFVNVIYGAPATYSGFDNLMATLGFGIQILCDFWGYSLMALGAAYLFAYQLPSNFNLPYASLSIRDFWRRWHITLSNWLRDYLYIALGGSRTNQSWKIQRNLALTMLLGGLWHGASWNFVIWGAIHGIALVVNRWFDGVVVTSFVGKLFRQPVIAWSLTMSVVFVAWIFFRLPNFSDALVVLQRIVIPAPGWAASKLSFVFFELCVLYLLAQWAVHTTTSGFNMAKQSITRQVLSVAFLAAVAFVYYTDGNQFIYFNF
jgi:alginate O-acetyltransferase complex protein AlgI